MNILDADELNNNLNHFTILDSRWKLGQKNYLDFEYNKGLNNITCCSGIINNDGVNFYQQHTSSFFD